MTTAEAAHDRVREYYGRTLTGSDDLRTDACCVVETMPLHLRHILRDVDDEILEKFYGCGSPIPPALDGCAVLDLGCGTGRDAYLCSKLVGEHGRVIGVDITEQQLEVAIRHRDSQARRFGYHSPNTTFMQGYMEDLAALGIEDETLDVVISNCVINLSPNKARVFSEIFRVLRPGGELLFSDVFADRRPPKSWREDAELVGECLAGAMYLEDFRRLLLQFDVRDFRIVTRRPLAIEHPEIAHKIGNVRFSSITLRAFKLDSLEDRCEDYGQTATYRGTIPFAPHRFRLDDHHDFITGKPTLVCGNTAAMLERTRLFDHFRVEGDRRVHFGLFPCGPGASPKDDSAISPGCC